MTHTRRPARVPLLALPLAMPGALVLTALLSLSSIAAARQPEPTPDPLRGPSVPEYKTRTLVHHSMMQGFSPVEGRPESAALELLELDEATAARARAAVDARSLELAMMLVDEIDTVREITDQMASGDTKAARETLAALWDRFEPGRPRSPLLNDLGEILTPEQMAEMHRLLDEYWDAWIRGTGLIDPAARQSTQDRLAFELFQAEVREAYDASLRRYREALDAIFTAIEPTTEQREQIRSIVIEHIRQTRLSPTIAQRREAMTKIYRLLDDDRRERLFDYMVRFVVREG